VTATTIDLAHGSAPVFEQNQPVSLGKQAANRAVSPQEQKLRKAAAEFESILLSSFWKSMKESFGDSEESSDPAHDTLDDWGIQAMTTAMGKAGGLGIGKLILKHLEPALAHATAVKNETTR